MTFFTQWHPILSIIWAGSALVFLVLTIILAVRLRKILSWKKALVRDLDALRTAEAGAAPEQVRAVQVIRERCDRVMRSSSPVLTDLRDLPEYVVAIAECFHPDAERPELQITVGRLLNSLRQSLDRFDDILRRPGLKRLNRLTIRHIRGARDWYAHAMASPFYRWVFRHWENIMDASALRLFIMPDPAGWLAYLSRRLTVLTLVRYLLTDIYIFAGRLALAAYGGEQDNGASAADEGEVMEHILADLDQTQDDEAADMDPVLLELRRRIIRTASLRSVGHAVGEWKASVREAAGLIAGRHFPEAPSPVESAAVGPLLARSRVWLTTLARGENHRLARRLYDIRLITLYKTKDMSDLLMNRGVGKVIIRTYKTYGWLKWPLKAFRWIKKMSPWRVALDVGWEVSKRASAAYLCATTFETACRELDAVYRLSRRKTR